MTVLSYTNAFLGIPTPNKTSGASHPQSYLYPGAVQPQKTAPTVLSYTKAFLGINAPQHGSGLSSVLSYLYPGAIQPPIFTPTGPTFILMAQIVT